MPDSKLDHDYFSKLTWGHGAQQLVRYSRELNPKYPSVMVIRHSERDEPTELELILKAQLTETGKKAAYHFGRSLPYVNRYRLLHSPTDRTRDTANQIALGINDNEGETTIEGPDSILSHVVNHDDAYHEYLGRDGGQRYVTNWVSCLYPLKKIESSLCFAKRFGVEAFGRMTSSIPEMSICVSHDIFIMTYLFHWFGLMPKDMLSYLDGFIMQEVDEKLRVYHKNGVTTIKRPYWAIAV